MLILVSIAQGTSQAHPSVVMPSEELLYNGKLEKLAVSLLANYLRPVSEGKMTLKVAELPAIGKHNLHWDERPPRLLGAVR